MKSAELVERVALSIALSLFALTGVLDRKFVSAPKL